MNEFVLVHTTLIISTDRSYVSRAKKLKEIRHQLGLPEKPKRALTAYNRFFKDTYATLENVETRTRRDVAQTISALWKQCDPATQQKYKEAFEKDLVLNLVGISGVHVHINKFAFNFQIEYHNKKAAYENQLSKCQVDQLKLAELVLTETESDKKAKKHEKKLIEVNKPKRTKTPFNLFCIEARQHSPTKLTLTELAAKYNALDESERRPYVEKSKQDSERYR